MVEPPPDPKRQRLDEEDPDEGAEALDAAAEADGIQVLFPADLDADETTLADYASHQDVLDKVRELQSHSSGLICPSAAWRQQQLGRPAKNMGIMLATYTVYLSIHSHAAPSCQCSSTPVGSAWGRAYRLHVGVEADAFHSAARSRRWFESQPVMEVPPSTTGPPPPTPTPFLLFDVNHVQGECSNQILAIEYEYGQEKRPPLSTHHHHHASVSRPLAPVPPTLLY
mgnify:CR=1 FL=1